MMSKKYFKLLDDVDVSRRWWLKTPRDAQGQAVNPDIFSFGQELNLATPLSIAVRHDGSPLDFTFAAFDMPVVNRRTLHLLDEFAPGTFQAFSAKVENHSGDYAVINFLKLRKCVDELRSEFLKWTDEDNRPDKVGNFRQITKLQINPTFVEEAEVFRLQDFKVILIASERLQQGFLDHKITGVRFRPVC